MAKEYTTTTKSPALSKTVWAGLSVTTLSALAIAADVWSLLDYDQLDALREIFGPKTTAFLGIFFIGLRVVTTRGLSVSPKDDQLVGEVSDEASGPDYWEAD